MSRQTIRILASLVGSAIGMWWVMNQRRARTAAALTPPRDHGRVIFDNTPTAADLDPVV